MRGAGTMARIQALVLVKVDRPLALNLVEGFLEAGRYRLPDSGLQGFTAVTAHGKGCPLSDSLAGGRGLVLCSSLAFRC